MKTEEIIELLFDLIPHTRLTEHVPGRIQFKFKLSALGVLQGVNLKTLANFIPPGILNTQTKLLSRTVIIDYDTDRLPYELLESLFQLREEPHKKPWVTERLKDLFEIESDSSGAERTLQV